jgi:hypothetical protein
MTRGKRKLFWMVPAGILGMALFVFIGGEIVMRLWNWLLPSLFGWRQLTFWQAVGILALCRILFGSHGFRGHRSSARRRIQERVAERYASMTPEEQERFRQSWRGRCGFVPPEGESQGQSGPSTAT